jgi:putative redox protein
MVEIEVAYEGDLHTNCRHAPSQAMLSTDAPVDNQGRGESFSPTDLLATALGSCALTTMGIVAAREGWDLAGSSARVEKHMVADPARRVGRLVVRFALPGGLDEAARETLEATAHGCPVMRSIHPQLETDLSFAWGEADAAR